jgi:hypothetical protein
MALTTALNRPKAQELIVNQFAILLYKEEVPRNAHVTSHHVTFRYITNLIYFLINYVVKLM